MMPNLPQPCSQGPIPWHPLDGDTALPYTEWPEGLWDEPALTMTNWGWRRRQAELLGARGVTALLTGQGGDLVFRGPGTPPYHLADLARKGQVRRLATELQRWRRYDRQQRSLVYWLSHYVVCPLCRHLRGRPVTGPETLGVSPWLRPDYVRRWQLAERGERCGPVRCETVAGQWFSDRLRTLCRLVAQLNQLPVEFEFRHPLLYRPLVEFVYALPWQLQLQPDTDRLLQRQALQGVLPTAVSRRRGKATFDQPACEGLRNGRAWLDALTQQPRLVDHGIVDATAWREAVARTRLGGTLAQPQFDAAATLEVWLRQFELVSHAARMTVPLSRKEFVHDAGTRISVGQGT